MSSKSKILLSLWRVASTFHLPCSRDRSLARPLFEKEGKRFFSFAFCWMQTTFLRHHFIVWTSLTTAGSVSGSFLTNFYTWISPDLLQPDKTEDCTQHYISKWNPSSVRSLHVTGSLFGTHLVQCVFNEISASAIQENTQLCCLVSKGKIETQSAQFFWGISPSSGSKPPIPPMAKVKIWL